MPDEAREVIFPRGIPVTLLEGIPEKKLVHGQRQRQEPHAEPPSDGLKEVATKAEAGLSSDAGELEQQARQAQPLDERDNLLRRAERGGPPTVRG